MSSRTDSAVAGTSHHATGPPRHRAPVSSDRALWTRRTRAGASFCSVTEATTLLLEGKTPCPCLQKRSRNPARPSAGEKNIGRFESLKPREVFASRAAAVSTRALGKRSCAWRKRGPRQGARRGHSHVCSIYTMELDVFMLSMKPRQCERTRPPCCRLHYERCSSVLYVV